MSKLDEPAERDPDIARLLSEPAGSPVNLTREQAIAVMEARIGADPTLGSGHAFVRKVRYIGGGLLRRD